MPIESYLRCTKLAAQLGWPELSKTALGTECWRLVDVANYASVRLCFEQEAVRRAGGPYLLEGDQYFDAVLVASDWDEVEEVIDGTFLKSAGIATPWSERQERLVAMGLPR